MDAAGHEVEGRAAVHLQRRARMVGEDEDWDMIGRRLAPPAAPGLIQPGAAHRPEHVSAHDPRADILEAAPREIVVRAGRSGPVVQALKGLRRAHPLMKSLAAHTERMLDPLVRPGAIAVDRDGVCSPSELRHNPLPISIWIPTGCRLRS